ncbi:hypothetical protein [Flavobacterium sp. C4GT6]|uniref:hypothetical protein n=1 Tax=Flavobacterium sp. C4GT6 TaxID=3103818 RepID=UPI002ED2F2EE
MEIQFVEKDLNSASVTYHRVTKEQKLIFEEAYLETEYTWTLSGYLGKCDLYSMEFSQYRGVSHTIGELSAEYLLDILNNDYCFDFDYEPKEGDILEFVYNYKLPDAKYMLKRINIECWSAFIFTKGKWILGRHYDAKLKRITQGFLKIVG